jgi:hypothetical protein
VIGTLGQFVREIRDKLAGVGDPIPVDIGGASITIDGDVTVSNEVEIKNDTGNPVPSLPPGLFDADNSTSANLNAGATFTGTGIEASPTYGTISVCILSSHASATGGLKFQASLDNINWETIEEYTYLAGSGLQSYSFAPSGRYFRLTYTNGGTTTTKLAIFTVLRSGYTKSSSHRVGDVISSEKDAELVKAVLAAMKPNGDFVDIHCTAGGNLKVSIEEVNGIDPIPVDDAGSSLTVDGKAYRAAVTITRPSNTTGYTAGDVIGVADSGTPANAGSAIITLPSIGPSGGYVLVQSVRLMIDLTSVTSGMAGFRLHLYTASPTAILDNAAFDLVSGEVANYAGFIDLPAPQDFGSTLVTQADYPGTLVKLASASTSLFAELETRGAYTPASGTVFNLRVLTLEAGL